jgi:superfamily I DNA and/or RNA helicase
VHRGHLLHDAELKPFADRISAVILDETGTTPESKMPLLLSLPSVGRIITVGDQQQLQPFTHIKPHGVGAEGDMDGGVDVCMDVGAGAGSTSGAGAGASKALVGYFHRLVQALPPSAIPTLTHNYRMHPNICEFVSDSFYRGRLFTPPAVGAARRAVDAQGMQWVSYPNTSAEVIPPDSKSY